MIDENGESVGVVSLSEALKRAEAVGLDLIQITDKADIPVAKIQEYGKLLYQIKQKEQKGKIKQKGGESKTLRLRPSTSEHDIQRMVDRAKEFLEGKNKVTFILEFKGRENAYPEFGEDKMKIIRNEIEDYAKIENDITRKGRFMNLVLAPK